MQKRNNFVCRFTKRTTFAMTFAMVFTLSSFISPCANAGNEYQTGVSLYSQGKYREAIGQFEEALQATPGNANAMYYAGLCYHQLGNKVKANSLFLTLITTYPNTPAGQQAKRAISAGSGKSGPPRKAAVAANGDFIPDSESVPFRRERGGHAIVDVQVNGRTMPMIFDTGAENVAIGKNQLIAAGVPMPANLQPAGYAVGVGGPVKTYKMPATIQLGRIKKTIDLSVSESAEHLPLLGQEFFGTLHYDMDNAQGRINFSRPGAKGAYVPNDTIDIPFRNAGKDIYVTAKVNGRDIDLIFDTGAQGTLFNKLTVSPGHGWELIGYGQARGVGGGGIAEVYNVDSIELGPIKQTKVQVMMMQLPIPDINGLLGQDFFGRRKYLIDYDKKVIRFFR